MVSKAETITAEEIGTLLLKMVWNVCIARASERVNSTPLGSIGGEGANRESHISDAEMAVRMNANNFRAGSAAAEILWVSRLDIWDVKTQERTICTLEFMDFGSGDRLHLAIISRKVRNVAKSEAKNQRSIIRLEEGLE